MPSDHRGNPVHNSLQARERVVPCTGTARSRCAPYACSEHIEPASAESELLTGFCICGCNRNIFDQTSLGFVIQMRGIVDIMKFRLAHLIDKHFRDPCIMNKKRAVQLMPHIPCDHVHEQDTDESSMG